MDNIDQRISELEKKVEQLSLRRITQQDIVPGVVKTRHMGQANRFVNSGLAADRPTSPPLTDIGTAIYFATDTGVLSIWDGEEWLETTLS